MPMGTFRPDDWYEVVEPGTRHTEQGEQLFGLTVGSTVFDPNTGEYLVAKETGDFIVATQSCDIVQKKVSRIEVVPVYPLSQWLFHQPLMLNDLESIRRGLSAGHYLLPGWPKAPIEAARTTRIVCFDEKLAISWQELEASWQNTRLALRSPYKEHFAQALARFYMRVGLPEDMPPVTWKSVPREAETERRLELTDADFTEFELPSLRHTPLVAIAQKLVLQERDETLYRVRLKEHGNWFGVGETLELARLSLCRLLEQTYRTYVETPSECTAAESDFLRAVFSLPAAP